MSTDRELLLRARDCLARYPDADATRLHDCIDAHLREPSRSQRLRDAGFFPRESIVGPCGLIHDKFKDEPELDERETLAVPDGWQLVPKNLTSKSDAQIAAELRENMQALLEPDDPGDKIKHHVLIRIMSRARNRLEEIAAALPKPPNGDKP